MISENCAPATQTNRAPEGLPHLSRPHSRTRRSPVHTPAPTSTQHAAARREGRIPCAKPTPTAAPTRFLIWGGGGEEAGGGRGACKPVDGHGVGTWCAGQAQRVGAVRKSRQRTFELRASRCFKCAAKWDDTKQNRVWWMVITTTIPPCTPAQRSTGQDSRHMARWAHNTITTRCATVTTTREAQWQPR
jgi:hypothetical protein